MLNPDWAEVWSLALKLNQKTVKPYYTVTKTREEKEYCAFYATYSWEMALKGCGAAPALWCVFVLDVWSSLTQWRTASTNPFRGQSWTKRPHVELFIQVAARPDRLTHTHTVSNAAGAGPCFLFLCFVWFYVFSLFCRVSQSVWFLLVPDVIAS